MAALPGPDTRPPIELASHLRHHVQRGRRGRAIASSTGQYFEQVVVAPAGFEAFGLDAARGGRLLLEEVERQAAQDREVLGGLADPHAALILAEGHVEHPMHLVLDAPMRTHRLAQLLSGALTS